MQRIVWGEDSFGVGEIDGFTQCLKIGATFTEQRKTAVSQRRESTVTPDLSLHLIGTESSLGKLVGPASRDRNDFEDGGATMKPAPVALMTSLGIANVNG